MTAGITIPHKPYIIMNGFRTKAGRNNDDKYYALKYFGHFTIENDH